MFFGVFLEQRLLQHDGPVVEQAKNAISLLGDDGFAFAFVLLGY